MSNIIARLNLPDADATAALALHFASIAKCGDIFLLEGHIGAGKTHFSRSFIRAFIGPNEDVPSPTFTLVQTYGDAPEIWHADLYRLTHPDEVIELGLEEAFQSEISLVEWPDRLGSLTPKQALTLSFNLTNEGNSRCVTLQGDAIWGARLSELPFENILKGSESGQVQR